MTESTAGQQMDSGHQLPNHNVSTRFNNTSTLESPLASSSGGHRGFRREREGEREILKPNNTHRASCPAMRSLMGQIGGLMVEVMHYAALIKKQQWLEIFSGGGGEGEIRGELVRWRT